MVDGTLEVKIHVEPRFKAEFHRLFAEIDMPVALAPLMPNYQAATSGVNKGDGGGDDFDPMRIESPPIGQIATFTINDAERRDIGRSSWTTLGPLCQSAIELGKAEAFQKFVAARLVTQLADDPETNVAEFLRRQCQIESRKEIDTNPVAAGVFKDIMRDYREWLRAAAQ